MTILVIILLCIREQNRDHTVTPTGILSIAVQLDDTDQQDSQRDQDPNGTDF